MTNSPTYLPNLPTWLYFNTLTLLGERQQECGTSPILFPAPNDITMYLLDFTILALSSVVQNVPRTVVNLSVHQCHR